METKSKAKEINILFKKYDKLIKSYYELAHFEEPIAQLIRRNGTIQFFEGATKGNFTFEHSDGTEKTIVLDPRYIKTFKYGRHNFRGYILDEDNATPLPDNPYLSSELYTISINKTLNDQKDWHAKEITAKGNMMLNIFIGIGLVVLIVGIYIIPQLLRGGNPDQVLDVVPAVKPAAQTIAQNMTTIFQ